MVQFRGRSRIGESIGTTESEIRSRARYGLIAGTSLIAAGYASAFLDGGPPRWAAWTLVLGIPLSIVAILALGAVKKNRGLGKLAIPFALVFLLLVGGFSLSLGLGGNDSIHSKLWLGLPLRAAIIIYGIGLIPIVVLPIAYALTFETQTLNSEDVQRVKQLGTAYRNAQRDLNS